MTGTGITERANAIRAEVERLPSLRQEATNAEAVTTRADQLEKLASDLRTRTARFQLFQDQGLAPHIVRERPETLLAMTRMHRSRFEDDRSSIAADPEDSGLKWRYRDELSRLIHSIDRAWMTPGGTTWTRSFLPGSIVNWSFSATPVCWQTRSCA